MTYLSDVFRVYLSPPLVSSVLIARISALINMYVGTSEMRGRIPYPCLINCLPIGQIAHVGHMDVVG
jgi:hypothetical protein